MTSEARTVSPRICGKKLTRSAPVKGMAITATNRATNSTTTV